MESLKQQTVTKILRALYKRGKLYTSQIAYETDVTLRHLSRILPKMVREDLVSSYPEENKKYYELTEKGKAVVWALDNPDDLAALSSMEETAKVRGRVELPQTESPTSPFIINHNLAKSLSEILSVFSEPIRSKEPIKGLDEKHRRDLVTLLDKILQSYNKRKMRNAQESG